MNNKLTVITRPAQAWTAALVFLFPCLSLVTLFGVGLASFLFLLTALLFYQQGRAALILHWDETRWVVLSFLAYFAFAGLCFALRPEAPLSNVERPARMFFAVSALMLVLAVK
ncbi:MAG TPA: O-antigen ligase family protein, partial [Telluria sp.]|nr:O-antigen ligase family protein [Telluria sp.]